LQPAEPENQKTGPTKANSVPIDKKCSTNGVTVLFSLISIQTHHAAIAKAMYKIVQTGAKTREEGVKSGFWNTRSLESTEPEAIRKPAAPTPGFTPRKITKDWILE
jgi:hypothetical protein